MPVAAPRWGDAEEFMDRLKDTSDGAGDEAWEWDGDVSSGRERLEEALEPGKGGFGDRGAEAPPDRPFMALLLGLRLRSGSLAKTAS